jgi:lactoylglutathione lyase
MIQTVDIERVAHIGIRVRALDRALAFYEVLGFSLSQQATGDDVAFIRNPQGVEINLIFNANSGDPARNILMDVGEKYPGITHAALYVASIPATIGALKANDIAVTQGPVRFGEDGGVSVFIRDPDRNVIELRGPYQADIEGVTRYVPRSEQTLITSTPFPNRRQPGHRV